MCNGCAKDHPAQYCQDSQAGHVLADVSTQEHQTLTQTRVGIPGAQQPSLECRARFAILKSYAACLCSVSSWQRVALPGRVMMNVRKRLSSLSTAARNCKIASAPSGSSQNFSVPLTR